MTQEVKYCVGIRTRVESPEPTLKLSAVVQASNLSAGEVETGGSPEFTGQQVPTSKKPSGQFLMNDPRLTSGLT